MKKLRLYIALFLTTSILTIVAIPTVAIETPFHVMFLGKVELKKPDWSKYHQIKAPAMLRGQDIVRTSRGTAAKFYCSDLKVRELETNQTREIKKVCPPTSRQQLVSGRSKIAPTRGTRGGASRGANNPTIPYIISPRNTSVLAERPVLRWNRVEGANSYTVEVQGPEVNWKTKTSSTEIVYPGSPPLKKGLVYQLIVVADNGASSRSERGGRFSVLSSPEVQQVQATASQLKQHQLTSEAEALALANIYINKNLNAEAIELLEDTIERNTPSIALYQNLGDIYRQVGLNLLATKPYLEALKLAEAEEDVARMAAAQVSLGEVEMSLGNKDEAVQWLEKAVAGYRQLGDSKKISQLQRQISRLI
ncbi:MAG: tetratricopeptide repeat protein [Prochloraceae cyanobacterium]|nr:tetratricopeptide repeat protein [Prochloraceae cyanobacterium]